MSIEPTGKGAARRFSSSAGSVQGGRPTTQVVAVDSFDLSSAYVSATAGEPCSGGLPGAHRVT